MIIYDGAKIKKVVLIKKVVFVGGEGYKQKVGDISDENNGIKEINSGKHIQLIGKLNHLVGPSIEIITDGVLTGIINAKFACYVEYDVAESLKRGEK